jgi:hypothetical protein
MIQFPAPTYDGLVITVIALSVVVAILLIGLFLIAVWAPRKASRDADEFVNYAQKWLDDLHSEPDPRDKAIEKLAYEYETQRQRIAKLYKKDRADYLAKIQKELAKNK